MNETRGGLGSQVARTALGCSDIGSGRVRVELAFRAGAILGESPVWDEQRRVLLCVDITRGLVFEFSSVTLPTVVCQLAPPVSALALGAVGEMLLALRRSVVIVDDRCDVVRAVTVFTDGPASLRLNDGKVDPWGGFVVGTLDDTCAVPRNRLFRLSRSFDVSTRVEGLMLSNGMGWSADRKHFYVVDSARRTILHYDVDPDSGQMGRERSLVITELPGLPDGLAVDNEGCLWVAMWGGFEVRRYTPTGELALRLGLPVSLVTSLAFGGDGLDELYITTARAGLTDEQVASEPHAGDVFWADIGISGPRTNRFGALND